MTTYGIGTLGATCCSDGALICLCNACVSSPERKALLNHGWNEITQADLAAKQSCARCGSLLAMGHLIKCAKGPAAHTALLVESLWESWNKYTAQIKHPSSEKEAEIAKERLANVEARLSEFH